MIDSLIIAQSGHSVKGNRKKTFARGCARPALAERASPASARGGKRLSRCREGRLWVWLCPEHWTLPFTPSLRPLPLGMVQKAKLLAPGVVKPKNSHFGTEGTAPPRNGKGAGRDAAKTKSDPTPEEGGSLSPKKCRERALGMVPPSTDGRIVALVALTLFRHGTLGNVGHAVTVGGIIPTLVGDLRGLGNGNVGDGL